MDNSTSLALIRTDSRELQKYSVFFSFFFLKEQIQKS